MKYLIFALIFALIFITFGCKKDIEPPPQRAETALLMDCVKDKELPNVTKGDTWIEGEWDGKYFSLSKNSYLSVKTTLGNFLRLGYQEDYAKLTEAYGNGLTVFPTDTLSNHHYLFMVNFPAFQGDSLAYMNYFSQFQKGKEFKFRTETGKFKDFLALETVEISFVFFQCLQTFSIQNRLSSGVGIDQTGSYFRITDVKEYIASGKVYRRDVTMEFDVKLGVQGASLSRIKNGRLFFSY